ncbi:MAG: hypothetical protein WC682_02135 [Parcubacteria group bacterium]|jgi:hypothetical protein
MKKVFVISLVMFLLVGGFYFIYNFLLVDNSAKNDSKASQISDNNSEKSNAPILEKVIKIIDGNIKGLTLDLKGDKIQYYNNNEKGFWLASFDGSIKERLSNDDFGKLDKVVWSNDKKEAILKMGDSFYLYKFGNKEKFIKKTKALSWMNFNQKIVYSYEDYASRKKTLNIANPDGSDWKELAKLESDDIIMSYIPESAKASFWSVPDAFKESNMTIIPFGEGELEKIGEMKFGSDYLWSNDGGKFLRSSVSQKGGNNLNLEVCEVKNNNCTNLNLPTMISKCAWSKNNKSVYCALPKNIDKNSVMPNDYLNNKFSTNDIFWKVNVGSGKKEKVLDEKYIKEELDATNLVISPNEDFLFFINKKNNNLFRIAI